MENQALDPIQILAQRNKSNSTTFKLDTVAHVNVIPGKYWKIMNIQVPLKDIVDKLQWKCATSQKCFNVECAE